MEGPGAFSSFIKHTILHCPNTTGLFLPENSISTAMAGVRGGKWGVYKKKKKD